MRRQAADRRLIPATSVALSCSRYGGDHLATAAGGTGEGHGGWGLKGFSATAVRLPLTASLPGGLAKGNAAHFQPPFYRSGMSAPKGAWGRVVVPGDSDNEVVST